MFNPAGTLVRSFFAFDTTFRGGVSVASGDFNGDGVDDIVTGAGRTGGPHVKLFDGATGAVLFSFFAYDAAFRGGVNVGVGDANTDGQLDIITGAGPGGGPHVKIFDGASLALLRSFFPYDASFTGGVFVAGGEQDSSGNGIVVTGAGPGGGPHVKVFDSSGALRASFFAYDASFRGGVHVAVGEISGDGVNDVITGPGQGGGPVVRTFDGAGLFGGIARPLSNFFAYSLLFSGGVFVAATDLNGDGRADIITGAGPGGGPHVKTFDGVSLAVLSSFFAYDPTFTGGVYVG
jgi:hypothetical protein